MGINKRKILTFLVAAVLCISVAFCVSGCGGRNDDSVMDPEAMAEYILENIKFDAEMRQVRNDSIGTFMELPDEHSGYMFMGDGSHSDGFGVFVFASKDDAGKAEKSIKTYLDEVEDSFSRYIPEEADKVKNHSFVIKKGQSVVYVISSDENADKLVKNFMDGEAVYRSESKDQDGDVDPADLTKGDSNSNLKGDTNDSENLTDGGTDEGSNGVTDGSPEEATNNPGEDSENNKNGSDDSNGEQGTEIDLSSYPSIETESKLKYIGYIGMIGKSAYEVFDYVDGSAESYAKIINYAKKKLGDSVNVYDMLIPLSSGVTVPDKYYFEIHGSNQKKSIENIYEKLNAGVIPVRIFDNLMKHRDEYIYFRTDHHWTSLGAYYGYESWCRAGGVLPIGIDKRDKQSYGDFVGAFYNDTKSNKLLHNPDTLDAYFPVGDVYTMKKDWQGNKYKADVITDMSDSSVFYKYEAFIGGDQGMMTITNDSVNDDSVLVVVKESFGNCLVPYLADHYHKTYVIDYRYTDKNIIDYAKKKKANDVIFVNNLGMTRSNYLIGLLEGAVKGN